MKKTFIIIIGCLILGVIGCQQPTQTTPGTTQTNYLESYIGTWNNEGGSEIVISENKISGLVYYSETETHRVGYAKLEGSNLVADGVNGLQVPITYETGNSYNPEKKHCKIKAYFKSLDKTILEIQFVDVPNKYDFGATQKLKFTKNIY